MRRAELKQLVAKAANERLESLRAMPPSALVSLMPVSSDTIPTTKATITTYRDNIDAGCVRIVVQGFAPGWLGSAYLWAQGFTLRPDGSRTALDERALWDFT